MKNYPEIYAVQKKDYENGSFRYYIEKVEIYFIKGNRITYENVASLQTQYAIIGLNAAYSFDEAIELEKTLINNEFIQEELEIEKTIQYIKSSHPELILKKRNGELQIHQFYRYYLFMRVYNKESEVEE